MFISTPRLDQAYSLLTETLALTRNQRRTASLLATLVALMLLFASLPLGGGLPPLWFGVLSLTLGAVLTRWGPLLPSAGAGRIPLLAGVAVFTASIVSGAAERGSFLQASTLAVAALVLVVIVCRLQPSTASSSRLRVMALAAVGIFTLCLRVAVYSSFASMKQGDFWVVDLPLRHALILPHPYDFYVVARLLPAMLWASMLASVICSGLYFWLRKSETRA